MFKARVYLCASALLLCLSLVAAGVSMFANPDVAVWTIFTVPLFIISLAGYLFTREQVVLYASAYFWPHLLGMRTAWVDDNDNLIIESFDRCVRLALKGAKVVARFPDAIIVDSGDIVSIVPHLPDTQDLVAYIASTCTDARSSRC